MLSINKYTILDKERTSVPDFKDPFFYEEYNASFGLSLVRESVSLYSRNKEKPFTPFETDLFTIEDAEAISNKMEIYVKKASRADKYDKYDLIEQILSFKTLQENWDGFGAIPLEAKSATNAVKILDALALAAIQKVSDIYPNPHGTISIEWENESDEIISAEIGRDSFSFFVEFNQLEGKYFDDRPIGRKEILRLQEFIDRL